MEDVWCMQTMSNEKPWFSTVRPFDRCSFFSCLDKTMCLEVLYLILYSTVIELYVHHKNSNHIIFKVKSNKTNCMCVNVYWRSNLHEFKWRRCVKDVPDSSTSWFLLVRTLWPRYPFVLRGVRLLGIDATLPWNVPGYSDDPSTWRRHRQLRLDVWKRLEQLATAQAQHKKEHD